VFAVVARYAAAYVDIICSFSGCLIILTLLPIKRLDLTRTKARYSRSGCGNSSRDRYKTLVDKLANKSGR